MRKNSQYISISEYCKANGLKPTKFYETLSRHPELAKKLKTNAKGERVLDEKAITAAGAILRKENRAKRGRSSASSAADEINILAAKNEVLRKEVSRLKCENEMLKAVLTGRNEKRRKTSRCKKENPKMIYYRKTLIPKCHFPKILIFCSSVKTAAGRNPRKPSSLLQ